MPQYAFDFDPHAEHVENVITGEKHLVSSLEGVVAWHHPLNTKKNAWASAVIYTGSNWGNHEGAPIIAPSPNYSIVGQWGLFKRITLPTGKFNITIKVDDSARLFLNGVEFSGVAIGNHSTRFVGEIASGEYDICLQINNTVNVSWCSFNIKDNGVKIAQGDTTWKCRPALSDSDTLDLAYSYTPRIFIPRHAPFFLLTDFVVRLNGNELTEGDDYYLGNYYELGSMTTGRLLYGSLWLVKPDAYGTLEIDYRTLGANYTATTAQRQTYIDSAPDVINDRWEDIIGDLHFPQVDVRFDRDAWKDEIALSDSIRSLGSAVEDRDPQDNDVFKLLNDWVTSLQQLILRSEMQTHQTNYNNPHITQWFDADALKVDGVAQNAARVFARSKEALGDYINARGITQTDLDRYMALRGDRTLTGAMIVKDNALVIEWNYSGGARSAHLITRDGEAKISSNQRVTLKANESAVAGAGTAKIRSGRNVLEVLATSTPEPDGLRINDVVVMTTGNMDDHVSDSIEYPFDLAVRSTSTLTITGAGTLVNPLRMTAIIPNASDVKEGAGYMASRRQDASEQAAITASLAAEANDVVNNLVAKTFTVNGKSIDKSIDITAVDIGLSEVVNVSDADMSSNANHAALLANKALSDHTHDFSELGVPSATTSVKGIAVTETSLSSSATDRFLQSSAISAASDSVGALGAIIENTLPNDVIDVTKYGEAGYLPMPVQGAYEGMGFYNVRKMSAFIEQSGRVIIYRNGYDVNVRGVWYAYADIRNDGSVGSYVATTTRYRPGNLPSEYSIDYTGRCSRTAMACGLNRNGTVTQGVIVFNNTGNGAKHLVIEVSNLNSFSDVIPFVHGNYVYILGTWTGNSSGIKTALARFPLTAMSSFQTVTAETVSLTGRNFFGEARTATDGVFRLIDNDTNDTGEKSAICWRKDTSYSVNTRWNNLGIGSDVKGDVLRVLVAVGTYEPGPATSHRSQWSYSYEINLSTMVITPDLSLSFPYVFNGDVASPRYVGNMIKTNNNQAMALKGANVGVCEIADPASGRIVCINSHNESTPQIVGVKLLNESQSYFDTLVASTRNYLAVNPVIRIEGNYGSIVGPILDGIAIVPGNRVYTADSGILCEYVPEYTFDGGLPGWGPTTNRVRDTDNIKYRNNMYITDGVTERCYGGILSATRRSSWIDQDPVTLATTGSISISSSNHTAFQEELVAKARETHPTINNLRYTLYVVGDTRIPTMVAFGITYSKDGGNASHVFYYHVTGVQRFGDIGRPRLGARIHDREGSSRYAGVTDVVGSYCNSGCYINGDEMAIVLNNQPGLHSNIPHSTVFDCRIAAKTINYHTATSQTYYSASSFAVTKQYGVVEVYQHRSMSAVLAHVKGKTSVEWLGGNKMTFVVQAVNPAEGWVIYFTQEIPFFIGAVEYSLPVYEIDLKTNFPTTHSSSKFYIYATIDGGTPHYAVSDFLQADSLTSIYVGYCTTGTDGILELQVHPALRLGSFRELEEHIESLTAHDFNIEALTKEDVGLGLIENKALRHNLVVPSFAEVFNSWKRFSHGGNGLFPSNAAELNTFTYDTATDRVMNTTNSGTFIGLVSLEKVGDYDFETTLSSTNGDDDFIGVVLGFVTDENGHEHTLSAIASGTDTRTQAASVVYNFGQSSTFGGGTYLHRESVAYKHGWDTLGTRKVTAKRRGDKITVTFSKYSKVPESSEVTWTIDLTSQPYLQRFRAACQFGYCASSQAHSTWQNHMRPDEDGKNYYASLKLLNSTYRWNERVSKLEGIASMALASDGWYETRLPLPVGASYVNMEVWMEPHNCADTNSGLVNGHFGWRVEGSQLLLRSNHVGGTGLGTQFRYQVYIFDDRRLNE